MYGIVACHGSGEAIDFLLTGFGLVEYRGRDSAGVALADRLRRDGQEPRNLVKSVTVE